MPAVRRAGPVALLLGLSALLFFFGLRAGELHANEGRRALLAEEVLRGGDWLVPTLYGEPLLTKPPGMAAAIALVSLPAGRVSALTARLPSALAATLAVLLVYATFARALGRRAGLVAGALLPCCPLWLGRVPSAEIDMVQLAWVTASLACLLRAVESGEERLSAKPQAAPLTPGPSPPKRGRRETAVGEWLWWQGALLCVAGGVLTKWTAPAFFYLTAVPLLWWRGRLGLLLRGPHLLAAGTALLVCLGWAGAVAARVGWDALAGAVGREALPRLSPAHHARPYPWAELATFPLVFLAGCLPWSGFALLTLRPGFAALWDGRARRLLQLLHCWAWVNLLFWALVPGHRARHALPLQPALAGLAAFVWVAWQTGRLRRPLAGRRPAAVLALLVLGWVAVTLAYAQGSVSRADPAGGLRARGEELAGLVPPGEELYLFGLKDEGLLFYCGRPARRLADPSRPELATAYYLLTEAEWGDWSGRGWGELLRAVKDERGAEVYLVRHTCCGRLPLPQPRRGGR